MFCTKETYDSLNIDFIINRIIVHTPYGERMKKGLKPFGFDEIHLLEEAYEQTDMIIRSLDKHRYTFVELRGYFKKIKALDGTFERLRTSEVLTVPELFEIKNMVMLMKRIHLSLEKIQSDMPGDCTVQRLMAVETLLDPSDTGINTFYIYDDYSSKLAGIRNQMGAIDKQIKILKKERRLELQDEINVKIRPNGEITANKENKELIQRLESCENLNYSAETYMNITYRIRTTKEMDDLMVEIVALKKAEEEEEYEVRKILSLKLQEQLEAIVANTEALGKLDLLMGKGSFAIGFEGVRPEISSEDTLRIAGGRHLQVQTNLKKEDKAFTPISVALDNGVTCITGANMGGKTVTLKLIGMLTVMAQMGLFVPAEAMVFTPRNFVYISVGDSQSTDMGLSTFGGEIVNVKEAIKIANQKGLILIDELARGTNPKEGYAISKAIINDLKLKDSFTVITTHFDGLADEEDVLHLQVCGLGDVDFEALFFELKNNEDEGMTILHRFMDYRLKVIHSPEEVPKDAINISRLMGLPESILEDAKEILLTM